jgi:DNA (cytosine-5)-methyltransferase 1
MTGRTTVADIFAGCGGGSIGFQQAGFRVVGAVEIDRDAANAYAANVGVEPLRRDIREVAGHDLLEGTGVGIGELTLLFGCPPCQSFTILRRGAAESAVDGIRNTLPGEYVRLVDELRPRHIAFENVAGMVDGRWRHRFDELLADLEELGYRCAWDVLDAADYGVPQRRRRVVVIGSRLVEPALPAASHAASGDGGLSAHRSVRDAIGGLRPLGPGETDPADPLHRARRHCELALRRLRAVPEGGGRMNLPPELQLACHQGHPGHYDIYGRMWWDRVAPTLTSGCTNVTKGRFAHPDQDRAITLREALLLQGFPADASLSGVNTDTMALQVGNAVPPPLVAAVGHTILEMEASVGTAARLRPVAGAGTGGPAPVVSGRAAGG